MTKQFVVGKQYKLVNASKDDSTAEVICDKLLQLPKDNTITCHYVDADGDCWSKTKGILWRGAAGNPDWMVASLPALISN